MYNCISFLLINFPQRIGFLSVCGGIISMCANTVDYEVCFFSSARVAEDPFTFERSFLCSGFLSAKNRKIIGCYS
ncbi:hypothetical protein XELAEV_18015684mg [Xenopus laevis]|uniref:Uncharacterized protein n=1 Tax=Xenopus laevis TaxID=8355 RepID=A0A974HW63_XENLA|nr:hypothetical protein XELAEV_18015684mg [Xenopus laevis]